MFVCEEGISEKVGGEIGIRGGAGKGRLYCRQY